MVCVCVDEYIYIRKSSISCRPSCKMRWCPSGQPFLGRFSPSEHQHQLTNQPLPSPHRCCYLCCVIRAQSAEWKGLVQSNIRHWSLDAAWIKVWRRSVGRSAFAGTCLNRENGHRYRAYKPSSHRQPTELWNEKFHSMLLEILSLFQAAFDQSLRFYSIKN